MMRIDNLVSLGEHSTPSLARAGDVEIARVTCSPDSLQLISAGQKAISTVAKGGGGPEQLRAGQPQAEGPVHDRRHDVEAPWFETGHLPPARTSGGNHKGLNVEGERTPPGQEEGRGAAGLACSRHERRAFLSLRQ